MRIVSLIASATEIIAALGLSDALVGISHECDFPPEAVFGRPSVTKPKIDVIQKSLDIHKDVQRVVSHGLSVYQIDVKQLKEVKPDIIITQDQCEVCAVTYDDVVNATQKCLGWDAKIVTLHPDSLDDIFNDILKVAKALNVEKKGKDFVLSLRSRMNAIAKRTENLSRKPKVVCLEWLNPLMVAGNWMPQMVEMAGGINGLTKKGEHTKIVPWEEIVAWDPDILVLMPCGFKISQTLKNRGDLENLPGFFELRSVKERKVFVVDGNAYMNRPGPRIKESLEILAGLFHPDLFKAKIPKEACVVWGGSSAG